MPSVELICIGLVTSSSSRSRVLHYKHYVLADEKLLDYRLFTFGDQLQTVKQRVPVHIIRKTDNVEAWG